MEVRFATEADVDAVTALGHRMFQLARFANLEFDWDKSRRVIQHGVDSGGYMLGVAITADGEIAGFHLACMEQYFFSDDWLAQSVLYFVSPEHRGSSAALRLLRMFWRWAEHRGAREIVLGTGLSEGTSLARMDRFIRRVGLDQVGGLYARRLA